MHLHSRHLPAAVPRALGRARRGSDAILQEAGLRPADAGKPDRFIPLRAAVQAVETAAVVTDTEDFGRRLAARRSIETIGPLGAAARSAPTLDAAFAIFSGYISAHSPGLPFGLTAENDSETTFFEFRIVLNPPTRQRQAVELGLGAALQILRTILGAAYTPLAVHVPHSALTPTVRHFGCTARFAQERAGFVLRAVDLRRSLHRDDRTHDEAIAELSSLVDGDGPSLVHVVTDIARNLLPTGVLTIDVAAEQLGLRPRTLQRRLAAEDATFAALVDDVRRQTAQRYLRDTDIGFEDLTRLLGYSEQSVLTRSCQRWFASSPTAYRNSTAR